MTPVTLTMVVSPTASVRMVSVIRRWLRRWLSAMRRPVAPHARPRGLRNRPDPAATNPVKTSPSPIKHVRANRPDRFASQGGTTHAPGGARLK